MHEHAGNFKNFIKIFKIAFWNEIFIFALWNEIFKIALWKISRYGKFLKHHAVVAA